jgi:hypothetical protein
VAIRHTFADVVNDVTDFHEAPGDLSETCRDLHRAINSLREELEAVDWYQQGVGACHDAELDRGLEHNRDVESEHACGVIEWLRRNLPTWDENLRKYLFVSGSIVEAEVGAASESAASEGAASESAASESDDVSHGLGLGKLGEEHR